MEEKETIIHKEIEQEMKQSYLDYAMSVIVGRALPDVRDGLKPVHRRILYAMYKMGMTHNKPYKKSARIVGEVLGKYHPHGDTAVYDSMVRMAQPWSLRYLLVDGQGNFGSIDGDRAAAMRYTEARLQKIAEELLQDIEKDTVKFVPNFDNSLKEPSVLPSKIPNLLINGSSGIAVGMATNIPPHNFSEITNATIKLIENPETTIEELMQIVKGPDFPTAGIISGSHGIKEAYRTGRGKITVKARTEIEETKNKKKIIITEVPYQLNKAQMVEQVAMLAKEKRLSGISTIRDESDREGLRVVIEVKSDFQPEVVLNQLYKLTRLKTTFGIIMLALVNNEPKVLNLKQLLYYFIEHRKDVIVKRTQFDLKKAEEKAHILEGLIIALDNIDEVIQKIKASKDTEVAKITLISDYKLTETQAKAILEMRLQRLSNLEQQKLKDDYKQTKELVEELKSILADESKIFKIIKDDLVELNNKYGDERKTQIIEQESIEIKTEDLIKEEDVVVTVTHSGYVKRLPIDTYKTQNRGGKGVIAAAVHDNDFIEHLFVASTKSYLLLFTDKGKVHWLRVYDVPEAGRTSAGKPIINLIEIPKDEKITTIIPVKEFTEKRFLTLATKSGIVKKTSIMEYSRPRKGGIFAINLKENDSLINAALTDDTKEILLATKNGLAIRFDEKDLRSISRVSKGVKGISLKPGDQVIGMVTINPEEAILTLTEKGHGKRTNVSEYRQIKRAGTGVINIKTTEKNGKVICIHSVKDTDELMMISEKGIMIRIPVNNISIIGRNTQGVRVMKLKANDKLIASAKISNEMLNNNN